MLDWEACKTCYIHDSFLQLQTYRVLAAVQEYDALKQQLHKLSEQHSALFAHHQAWPAKNLATHDSELARLRSKLAQARVQAGMDADKLAAALETCRYDLPVPALQLCQYLPYRSACVWLLCRRIVHSWQALVVSGTYSAHSKA